MKKITELQKSEMLERAVLQNDISAVQQLFNDYAPFEFTARALGNACIYGTKEMFLTLLDNGVSFDFEYSRKLRELNCLENLKNGVRRKTDFSLSIFKNMIQLPAPVNTDEQRQEFLQILLDRNLVDPGKILYYAILYSDTAIKETLNKNGINKLSDYYSTVVAGLPAGDHKSSWVTYDRNNLWNHIFDNFKPIEAVSVLQNFLDCMDEKFIKLKKSDFYVSDGNSLSQNQLKSLFFCEESFEFFIKNTNMLKVLNPKDMVFALIDNNNAAGLDYAYKNNWIKEKAIEDIAAYTLDKDDASVELKVLALNLRRELPNAKKENIFDELSLEEKPLSDEDIEKTWKYEYTDDYTIRITGYIGNSKNVVIPERIGYSEVTEISPNTFSAVEPNLSYVQKVNRCEIESIEFPSTLRFIPENILCDIDSFYGSQPIPLESHNNITRIVINNGPKKIGDNAFGGCENLKEITIPESVKSIGDYAFMNCEELEEIILPEGLERIGSSAFHRCQKLKEIYIPDSVKEIGQEAFFACNSLTQVNIPKSLETLEYGLFYRCAIKEISIPNTVKNIKTNVFYECSDLKHIKLPDSITKIPENFFRGCKSLKSIDLPEGIEIIDAWAFKESAIEEITLPKSLKTIEMYAFAQSDLKSIKIPESVESIKYKTFEGCRKLEEVEMSGKTQVGEDVFKDCPLLANEKGEIVINGILQGVTDRNIYSKNSNQCVTATNSNASMKGTANSSCENISISWALPPYIKGVNLKGAIFPEIIYREGISQIPETDLLNLSEGDEVEFGRFPSDDDCVLRPLKWKVLAVKGKKALLLSTQCIMYLYEDLRKGGSWQDSTMRKLLNGEFYKIAFSEREKEQILLSHLLNKNKDKSSFIKTEPTDDFVFLLSADEFKKYKPITGTKAEASAYALKQNRIKGYYDFTWCSRTISEQTHEPISFNLNGGKIEYPQNMCMLIRPAVWVKQGS